MASPGRIVVVSVFLWIGGVVHSIFTWPPSAGIAFFLGGGLLTATAEAVGVNLGWLEHHVPPKIIGVPVYLPLAWTGTVYIPFRVMHALFEGWIAVVLTAVILTGYDVLTDHYGVAEGYWSYTGGLSGPRFRGVPWWNYAAWFTLSAITASLALPFL